MTVTVYTRNACGARIGTKAMMDRLGISYTEINVEDHPDIAQQLVDDGWRAMPVVISHKGEWSGMNKQMIESLVD